MDIRYALTAGAVASALLTVAPPPALADHNTCGSGHGFQTVVPTEEISTGTVDSFDRTDFWHDISTTGAESLRLITLVPVTNDTDLYVWNDTCTTVICSSAAGAGVPDTCVVDVNGSTYVEARNFGGNSSQYTLTVTYVPLFIQ